MRVCCPDQLLYWPVAATMVWWIVGRGVGGWRGRNERRSVARQTSRALPEEKEGGAGQVLESQVNTESDQAVDTSTNEGPSAGGMTGTPEMQEVIINPGKEEWTQESK